MWKSHTPPPLKVDPKCAPYLKISLQTGIGKPFFTYEAVVEEEPFHTE